MCLLLLCDKTVTGLRMFSTISLTRMHCAFVTFHHQTSGWSLTSSTHLCRHTVVRCLIMIFRLWSWNFSSTSHSCTKSSPAPLLSAPHRADWGTHPPGGNSASSRFFFSNKHAFCLKGWPNPGVLNRPTCSPSAHFKQQEDQSDTCVSFPQAAPDHSHGLCAIHGEQFVNQKQFLLPPFSLW